MRSKLKPNALADLFSADPPPPAAPTHPLTNCIACMDTYRTPAPICPACAADPRPRLDAAEREVARHEEMLAGWCLWLDEAKAKAPPAALARYAAFEMKLVESVTDTKLYDAIMATVNKEIALGSPLGLLFAAMRRADVAATKISAALDHLAGVQSALLWSKAARGWTIPDDVHERRLALGQPTAGRTDELPVAIRQMRQEVLV